jgi:excisionase family DNA binding protein
MERFNTELFLTTSQVAEILAVHPSTVKRWCNDGDIVVHKTDGGHRRIHLTDVLALAEDRGIPSFLQRFAPYEAHVWSAFTAASTEGDFSRIHSLAMGWLHRGHLRRIGQLFVELARQPDIDLADFCDRGLRGFMVEIGETWRAGRLRVGEEHMATEAIVEALFRIRAYFQDRQVPPLGLDEAPPIAVVGSMEGDRHNIGSLCARLLLEQNGWDVYYLGADVPVEDFSAIQKAHSADLVCISFAPPNTAADMKRCVRILSEFYDPASPFTLALGGDLAEEPSLEDVSVPFQHLALFGSMRHFDRALSVGLGSSASSSESASEQEGVA